MDFCDNGQELEQRQRDEALARQQEKMPTGVSQSECRRCGCDIPLERQAAVPGVSTCVDCQGIIEQKQRGY